MGHTLGAAGIVEAVITLLALEHGFVPGTEATVSSRAPDGTLVLDLGARTIALGSTLARQLFVTAA